METARIEPAPTRRACQATRGLVAAASASLRVGAPVGAVLHLRGGGRSPASVKAGPRQSRHDAAPSQPSLYPTTLPPTHPAVGWLCEVTLARARLSTAAARGSQLGVRFPFTHFLVVSPAPP
eukprot:scaffold280027_cov30-Tisochrysis_lutea.AAC.1